MLSIPPRRVDGEDYRYVNHRQPLDLLEVSFTWSSSIARQKDVVLLRVA
jgi:hypothetical protein